MIQKGKVLFKGIAGSGVGKQFKKFKDFGKGLLERMRFKAFRIRVKNRRFILEGLINPWAILANGKILEVKGEYGKSGGGLKKHDVVDVYTPGKVGRPNRGIILKNRELAEQLKQLPEAQRKTAYRNLRDFKRLHPNKTPEIHHIATNKNAKLGEKWTNTFDKLFKKGGLSLDDDINKVLLKNHAGPHPGEYHQWVLDRLLLATKGLKGQQAYKSALEIELRAIAADLRKNPKLLWGP